MPLEIISLILGAIENNTYLLADTETGLSAVVDPSFDIQPAAEEIRRRGWTLDAIWLTHAHFDHIAGVSSLLQLLGSAAPIALHPADLPLYHGGGGASIFGFELDPLPKPALLLSMTRRYPLAVINCVFSIHRDTHPVTWLSILQKPTAFSAEISFSTGELDAPTCRVEIIVSWKKASGLRYMHFHQIRVCSAGMDRNQQSVMN